MDPGPVDASVLHLSARHRAMICAQDDRPLKCVAHFSGIKHLPGDDPRVQAELARAGFLHFSRLSYVRLDHALITSLVERWRPETCTFHTRVGEMTITLQDVAILLGLRVDGPAVTGRTNYDWKQVCIDVLGRAPEEFDGAFIKLTWLREAFHPPGPDATHLEIVQYTRAYILHQIGCTLFCDMSKNMVHLQWLPLLYDLNACGTLSWGSAVLAYIYDELTTVALRGRNTIGGCLTLLQLWSWSRLSVGRPTLLQDVPMDGHKPLGCRFNVSRSWDTGPDRAIRFYRNELDLLEPTHVQWCPYPDAVLQTLPPLCTQGAPIWRSRTSIICFDVVQMHLPDRVLRQFGLSQHLPEAAPYFRQSERRGRADTDWAVFHFGDWEARRKALSNIFGDWVQSYLDLPSYLLAIRESNPGTVFTLRVDPIHDSLATFRAVFWAFGPSIEGFHHCRPLLSIDGTHLYGKYPGVLLVATGVDADGGLFPLAFAVVNTEDKENWEWFFACIREYIPSVSSREITWISDRMKGISNALQQGWRIPHHHRYCLRHIKANFKRSFKDEPLQNMLYNAGRTPDSLRYTELRNRIKELSPDADKWIEKSLGPENEERWALCKDGGRRYCIMTTNCSESFNSVLKGARALPIQSLIARTFYRLNKYFVTRRELSAKWRTRFAPKVENLLRARNDESRSYELRRYSEINWEVIDNRGFSYSVDMTDTECSCNCNVPMLQKLPCTHVIAATSRVSGGANIDYGILCSDWYTAERYRQTYEPKFKPIPDRRYWNKDLKLTLAPPDEKRKKGRPRSTRLRNEMDYSEREGDKKKTKCSKCKKYGHNKKRCTAA